MWQDTSNPYAPSSSHQQPQYYTHQPHQQSAPLQFYDQQQQSAGNSFNNYPGSRPSLEGSMGAQGTMSQGPANFGGNIHSQGGWWTAFGTGGFEGEPPLLEELGINFSHIRAKLMTVLNPLSHIDERIMDDADLAGPILFIFCFGICLLLSGKSNFGYIYGVGLFGSVSIYTLLNLMSEKGIDAFSVTSVLGYCLLPMVGLAALNVIAGSLDHLTGYGLAFFSVSWCTYSASGILVTVMRMSDQRVLVAYPVGLLYGCFALLSVFSGSSGKAAK